jgi:hypothetical protein
MPQLHFHSTVTRPSKSVDSSHYMLVQIQSVLPLSLSAAAHTGFGLPGIAPGPWAMRGSIPYRAIILVRSQSIDSLMHGLGKADSPAQVRVGAPFCSILRKCRCKSGPGLHYALVV